MEADDDVSPGAQRHAVGGAHEDRHLVFDGITAGKQGIDVEIVERGPHHPFGLGRTGRIRAHAVEHDDAALAVAFGRTHEAVAGFFGVPGLQTVGTGKHAKQRIAVELADPVVGELAFGPDAVEVGMVPDQDAGDAGQVFGADHMVRVGPAGRVGEMGILEPQLPCPFRHHVCKRRLAAADRLGQHDTGVIARLHDHAAQQVLDPRPAVDLKEHGRRARRRATTAPRLFRHRQLVVQGKRSVLDRFQRHQHRHHLGHRGRRHRLVTILREQDAAGLVIHDHGMAGIGLIAGLGRRRSGDCRQDEKKNRKYGAHEWAPWPESVGVICQHGASKRGNLMASSAAAGRKSVDSDDTRAENPPVGQSGPGGVGPVAVSPATEKDAENLTLFGLPRLDPDFPSIGDTLRQPLSVGSVAEGAKLQRDGRSRGRRRSNGLGCRTVGRLRDGGRLRDLDDG